MTCSTVVATARAWRYHDDMSRSVASPSALTGSRSRVSGSTAMSLDAASSCSSKARRSLRRRERACSSERTRQRNSCASTSASRSESESALTARASSKLAAPKRARSAHRAMSTSRSPPRLCFTSGSRRYTVAPKRRCRDDISSVSPSRKRPRSPSKSALAQRIAASRAKPPSPATQRASSTVVAVRMSVRARATKSSTERTA